MLSRSSMMPSSSSSLPLAVLKNVVGGSCLGSPTMTTSFPLAMAPTDSAVGIWEASSKMTRSKCSLEVPRYWATDNGLMSMQGVIRGRRFGSLSKRLLRVMPRPPLRMALCRMPTSEEPLASFIMFGTLEASTCWISFLASSSYFSVTSLK